MKILGGCRVYSPEDGRISVEGTWSARSVVSREAGAERITQTMSEYSAGVSPGVVNPRAEEVLYVAAGAGAVRVNGFAYPLRAGCAVFVPPGAVYTIENFGPEKLRVVSSCCPEDAGRRMIDAPAARSGDGPRLMVHEDEREPIRAGKDRVFRYLVHTDLGCREITQFAGWIPPGKAPFHYHTYEEAIYILEGRGMVHVDGGEGEFTAGSSVYFPIGVRHCVENPGGGMIKLLGAFYPSGSPGAAYEDR
ncbi:MAG TPA: cupin domain-containing protein [Bryobacteraceae bacterium]|nr:cupin domain-containing protein [Bryobacteraceae bacterium]